MEGTCEEGIALCMQDQRLTSCITKPSGDFLGKSHGSFASSCSSLLHCSSSGPGHLQGLRKASGKGRFAFGMHSSRALCVLVVLMLFFGTTLGKQHKRRDSKAGVTQDTALPGGGTQLSSTDREHLDLYNYVTELFAQQLAQNSSFDVEFQLPFNNSGIKKKTADLLSAGLTFKEFYIPPGSTLSLDVPEVLFVYENLRGSELFGGKSGSIVSPILGLTCRTIVTTIGVNSSVITVTPPSTQAIVVTFPAAAASEVLRGSCQLLDPTMTTFISVPTSPVETAVQCKGQTLGTYCITGNPSPPPASSPAPIVAAAPPAPTPPGVRRENVSGETDTKVVVGATLGTIAGLALLAILLLWGYRSWHRQKIARMERESERGETLQTALMFGGSRAPAAGAMRTKPRLEDASIMEDAGFIAKGTAR